MKLANHHIFYLFTGALFLTICGTSLFSEGMFMDGLLYADLSRNMAQGLGSFWKPHLTNTLFPEFYEHPPLALGLQSLGFEIFGDTIYVERFYGLLMYVMTGVLLVMIWKQLTGEYKTGWVPLLLWLIVPDVAWAVANNMLENTMTVFVCLSVFLYLKSVDSKGFLWVILAGFALSLGLLSKGFFCLYIWGLPFFHWLFVRQGSFGKMVRDVVLIVLATCLPIMLLYFFSQEAHHNMLTYFNKQVLGSIESVQIVDSRFAIVIKFLENGIVPVALVIFVGLIGFRQKIKEVKLKQNAKVSLMLMAVVLSGILPIMISMKQRGFYILTVYPLFAIAVGYLLYPLIQSAWQNLRENAKGMVWFRWFVAALSVISVFICALQFNKIGRDKEMIMDTQLIIEKVGANETIGICPNLHSNWALHGYFSRYGNVSLSRDISERYNYLILDKNCSSPDIQEQYIKVNLPLSKYQLLELKQ